MSFYWAIFQNVNDDVFRFDTRIYLTKCDQPLASDSCIGAVVGKNPGSARPSAKSSQLQKVSLGNDKFLPYIHNRLKESYNEAKKEIPDNAYLQVLNLFYLCNEKLDLAKKSIKCYSNPGTCKSEQNYFPFVWYTWGKGDNSLNQFKKRFLNINAEHHFYFDSTRIIDQAPGPKSHARHPQGVKGSCFVSHISKIL